MHVELQSRMRTERGVKRISLLRLELLLSVHTYLHSLNSTVR
jgi:hypothetical protein